MAVIGFPFNGSFGVGCGTTATAATAIPILVPPYKPQGVTGLNTGQIAPYITHITALLWDTSDTHTHVIYVMRPLNYTTFSADAAAAQTTVTLTADPGLYSSAYNYGTANGVAPSLANNALASADYCVYQVADGTWFLDTAASGRNSTTGATTMTTNVPTKGVKKGGLFYWYGIQTDKNPADGFVHPNFTTKASTFRENLIVDSTGLGGVVSYNPGDPLIVLSINNDTTAGVCEGVFGYYSQR